MRLKVHEQEQEQKKELISMKTQKGKNNAK